MCGPNGGRSSDMQLSERISLCGYPIREVKDGN
jgi:hypothetical protein